MRTGNWGHGKPQAVPTVCSYTVVEPEPTNQSRSNSISRVLSETSRTDFLLSPLRLKLKVVHIRKWLQRFDHILCVDTGGTLDPRFAGSIPAGVDGIFSERKTPEYYFLRKGSKAVGPVS